MTTKDNVPSSIFKSNLKWLFNEDLENESFNLKSQNLIAIDNNNSQFCQ